jgi:hypothetical protein
VKLKVYLSGEQVPPDEVTYEAEDIFAEHDAAGYLLVLTSVGAKYETKALAAFAPTQWRRWELVPETEHVAPSDYHRETPAEMESQR